MPTFNLTHKNVKEQQFLANEGGKHISQAMDLEDKAANDIKERIKAIPDYREGVKLLERAVSLHLPPRSDNSPEINRAHSLRSKLLKNISYARERLKYLESQLPRNTASQRTNLIRIYDDDPPASSNPLPSSTNNRPGQLKPLPHQNRAAELRAIRGELRSGKPSHNNEHNPRDQSPSDGGPNLDRERKKLSNMCKSIPGLDSKLVDAIINEVIVKNASGVKFQDISGQEKAKSALREMVVLPALKPELFTGLRSPAKGLLLFGPPGNGKTLLAKALATESNCHLINISASSLTSKWMGEGEKLVKTLFSVARKIQPCIIFMDEIDSLLSSRRDGEHEASRRIKTEFLLQFEGMTTDSDERVIVVAATNRPQELDDAALRRLTKRIYVEMPDKAGRRALIQTLLKKNGSSLSENELERLARGTEGYTCSDLTNLAKDAAMAPLREMTQDEIIRMKPENMRKLSYSDFVQSCQRVRKSLNQDTLHQFAKWNQEYGDIST